MKYIKLVRQHFLIEPITYLLYYFFQPIKFQNSMRKRNFTKRFVRLFELNLLIILTYIIFNFLNYLFIQKYSFNATIDIVLQNLQDNLFMFIFISACFTIFVFTSNIGYSILLFSFIALYSDFQEILVSFLLGIFLAFGFPRYVIRPITLPKLNDESESEETESEEISDSRLKLIKGVLGGILGGSASCLVGGFVLGMIGAVAGTIIDKLGWGSVGSISWGSWSVLNLSLSLNIAWGIAIGIAVGIGWGVAWGIRKGYSWSSKKKIDWNIGWGLLGSIIGGIVGSFERTITSGYVGGLGLAIMLSIGLAFMWIIGGKYFEDFIWTISWDIALTVAFIITVIIVIPLSLILLNSAGSIGSNLIWTLVGFLVWILVVCLILFMGLSIADTIKLHISTRMVIFVGVIWSLFIMIGGFIRASWSALINLIQIVTDKINRGSFVASLSGQVNTSQMITAVLFTSILAIAMFIVGYILGSFRLPLYPVSALSGLWTYLYSRKKQSRVFINLHNSSLYWDEYVFLPIPCLKQSLLIAAEQNIEQAYKEIAFIAILRPTQWAAAQSALIEIITHDLEMCNNLPEIAQSFYQKKNWIDILRVTIFIHLEEISIDANSYYNFHDNQIRLKILNQMLAKLNINELNIDVRNTKLIKRLSMVKAKWRIIIQQEKEALERTNEKPK